MQLYEASHYCVIRLQGKDVRLWLHRLLTTDIKTMSSSEISWTYLLAATGKIKSAFELLTVPSTIHATDLSSIAYYDCIVLRAHADLFMQHLDMFLFTEDVQIKIMPYQGIRVVVDQIEDQSTLEYWHLMTQFEDALPPSLSEFGSEQSQRLPQSTQAQKTYIYSDDSMTFYHTLRTSRRHSIQQYYEFDWWLDEQKYEGLIAYLKSNHIELYSYLSYEARSIYTGHTSFNQHDMSRYSALDFGLHGIDEGKGCYPGQEVVERSIALGKAAKTLLYLSSSIDIETVSTQMVLKNYEVLTQQSKEQVVKNGQRTYYALLNVENLDHKQLALYDDALLLEKETVASVKAHGEIYTSVIVYEPLVGWTLIVLAMVKNTQVKPLAYRSSFLQSTLQVT